MFYNTVKDFFQIIEEYNINKIQKFQNAYSIIAEIIFKDGSILYIKDYLFPDKTRKYSFHWQDKNKVLIFRWDNSPHHKDLNTFPHHLHSKTKILVSKERNLRDILLVIDKLFQKTTK